MASLMGKFRPRPMTMMISAAIWCAISVLFLDASRTRIEAVRAAGQHVTAWRCIQLAIWALIFQVWAWNGWTGFKRYRADEMGKG